jgi:hypothetical protein
MVSTKMELIFDKKKLVKQSTFQTVLNKCAGFMMVSLKYTTDARNVKIKDLKTHL